MTKPKTPKSKEPAKPHKAHVADAEKDAAPEEKRTTQNINSPEAIQHIIAMPESNAALVMESCNIFGDQFDRALMRNELRAQIEVVKAGDMSQVEGMLLAQAVGLEAMFVNLARQAFKQTQLSAMEGLMRMALRAQNQSRMTLETLSAVKNPPVVYAKQANFAAGHQQINNATVQPDTPVGIESKPNELLSFGGTEHANLDTRMQSQGITDDSSMATVGALDRR